MPLEKQGGKLQAHLTLLRMLKPADLAFMSVSRLQCGTKK